MATAMKNGGVFNNRKEEWFPLTEKKSVKYVQI